MLHGRNLKVYKDGQAIACSRSCSIDTNGEVIEVSSKTSARAKTYIRGRYDWKVEVSGLVSTFSDLTTALKQVRESEVFLIFGVDESVMGGKALCTSVKVTGTLGNLVQLSATFQGSGELSTADASFYAITTMSRRYAPQSTTGDIKAQDIYFDSNSGCFYVEVGELLTTYHYSWTSTNEGYSSSTYNTGERCKDGLYYCISDQKIYEVKDGGIVQ